MLNLPLELVEKIYDQTDITTIKNSLYICSQIQSNLNKIYKWLCQSIRYNGKFIHGAIVSHKILWVGVCLYDKRCRCEGYYHKPVYTYKYGFDYTYTHTIKEFSEFTLSPFNFGMSYRDRD